VLIQLINGDVPAEMVQGPIQVRALGLGLAFFPAASAQFWIVAKGTNTR
jgi:hypothetical protein